MKYKFGEWVMTPKGLGIITQTYEANAYDGASDENQYFVQMPLFGTIYNESQLIEWTGAW